MKYEVLFDHWRGRWNCEAFDAEGRYYVTSFYGQDAEKRAREYCDWLNSAEFAA